MGSKVNNSNAKAKDTDKRNVLTKNITSAELT
jgi:hypothetical protein